jgi:DNA-binding response OmpR family regulator
MNPPRVLVVDDDPEIGTVVSRVLEGQGYAVEWSGNSVDALRRALADPPDVVILDVAMPRLGGWELCEILRRQSHTRDVGVLFLTGHAGVKDRITAMQVGGSDFVAKPFVPSELRRKVAELAGKGEMR